MEFILLKMVSYVSFFVLGGVIALKSEEVTEVVEWREFINENIR